MDFLINNYSWIVSVLLLALFYIQGKKISILEDRIKKLENR